jgi:hypothetical protein
MWESLRRRFPDKQAVLDVFYMCILVVEAWALFNLLREIPALRYRETPWDMIGIVSIVQLVALVESLLVAAVLVFAAALLPARWFRHHFVAQATLSLVVTAVWAIVIHYNPQPMTTWSQTQLGLWGGLYLLSLLGANASLRWFTKLETVITGLVKNGTLLAQVYLSLSLLALAIAFVRNWL